METAVNAAEAGVDPTTILASLGALTQDPAADGDGDPTAEDAVVLRDHVHIHTHLVIRPFIGGGLLRAKGEVVDGSDWRMVRHLEDQRRVRPLLRDDPDPVDDGEGRYFISDDALLAYLDNAVIASTPEEG